MKKIVYRAAFVLCVIFFTLCCGIMAYKYAVRHSALHDLDNIRQEASNLTTIEGRTTDTKEESPAKNIAESDVSSEIFSDDQSVADQNVTEPADIIKERGITIPEKNIDWDGLRNQNEDIYAWIYIPGTNIDYPILQHPEEKSYYLKHNIDGSEGYPGCIYTQNVNTKDWTDPNTVIYGHNMNDGSMFHDLHKFEDVVFFNETQYLFIYTPDGCYVYEIFAAYPFSNVDLIMCFDYSSPEALLVYFDGIWTNRSMTSHFRDTTVLYGDSRIITLSTCIGGQPEMRYLVQAVLLGSE